MMMDYVVIMRGFKRDNDVKQREVARGSEHRPESLFRYERGQNAMPVRFIPLLCDYYNVSSDYLLGGTREKGFPRRPTEAASWGPPGKTGKTKLKGVHESWLAVQSGFDAVKERCAPFFFCTSFFFLRKTDNRI